MKSIAWGIVAAVGVAVMIWAYRADRPADGFSPLSSGLLIVSKSASARIEVGPHFPATKAKVLQLPVAGLSTLLGTLSGGGKDSGRNLRFQLSEKLIELSLADAKITEDSLAWGKLPRIGRNEVLAGCQVTAHDRLEAAGTAYKITGGLRSDAAILARCYVLARNVNCDEKDDMADEASRPGVLMPLPMDQMGDKDVQEKLGENYPDDQFNRLSALPITHRDSYFGILLGQALLWLGGTGALIAWYTAGARRMRWKILRDPLEVLAHHRRLLWSVHAVYFGLYFLAAALIYQAPIVATILQAAIRSAFQGGSGLLGIVGKAYLSGNIPLAALATFVFNFFLGTIVMITLPSSIIPGSGALVAAVRALSWGVIFPPATYLMARGMLPHSGTLLLEGEGYILATFFALLFPLYLLRDEPGSTGWSQYWRAFAINLKGLLLVAIVLAVAACYEATEVILMARGMG
jgi:hypothetical protein